MLFWKTVRCDGGEYCIGPVEKQWSLGKGALVTGTEVGSVEEHEETVAGENMNSEILKIKEESLKAQDHQRIGCSAFASVCISIYEMKGGQALPCSVSQIPF